MPNWFDIIKVQVLDTITDLDINMEPMAEDKKNDCCEEARSQWIAEVRADIGQDEGYDIPPGGYLDGENLQNTSIIYRYENMSCEELREVLEDISGRKPGRMYKYHYTERKGHFGSPTILYYIGKDLLENWDRCEKNVQ